ALGYTHPTRHTEAISALQEVVRNWENNIDDNNYIISFTEIPNEADLQSGVHLSIDFPPGGNGFLLARLLPPRADYALLRGLLTQLSPTIEREEGFIWHQIEMRQPLNLTTV